MDAYEDSFVNKKFNKQPLKAGLWTWHEAGGFTKDKSRDWWCNPSKFVVNSVTSRMVIFLQALQKKKKKKKKKQDSEKASHKKSGI